MASANGSKSRANDLLLVDNVLLEDTIRTQDVLGFLLSGLEHASKENKLIAKRSKDKTSPPTFVDSVLPCLEALGLPTCSKVRHPTLVADGSGGLAHALRMLI